MEDVHLSKKDHEIFNRTGKNNMHFDIKTLLTWTVWWMKIKDTIIVLMMEPPYVTMRASSTEVDEVIHSFSPVQNWLPWLQMYWIKELPH